MSDRHPDPKIGPQVYLGPIKISRSEADYVFTRIIFLTSLNLYPFWIAQVLDSVASASANVKRGSCGKGEKVSTCR